MMSLFLFFFLFFLVSGLDVLFLFSLIFLCLFLGVLHGFSFFGSLDLKWGSFFSLDFISFFLVMLCFWLFSMVYLQGGITFYGSFMCYLLFLFLVISLVSPSILWFYLFFEASMFPIFFLVLGWGSGEDRLFSGFYMLVYTMVSSMPCLLIFLLFGSYWGFLSFDFFKFGGFCLSSFYYLVFSLVFVVKIPIFVFHIWLPKAHVDAPVYGSMILASVMLKLGAYGIFRLLDMFGYVLGVIDYYFCICLVCLFFVPLFCLFSVDMKVIVAYSSVVHMCMMVCGIFSGSSAGYYGGFLMSLSHGICSSGLFMVINMFYCRSGSRLLFVNKGLMGIFPVFIFFWLVFIMDNIGAPPSLSLFSEVYCLVSCVGFYFLSWFAVLFGLFVMSCVSMNLFFYVFGEWAYGEVLVIVIKDYFLSFFHLFPLNMISLFFGYFI